MVKTQIKELRAELHYWQMRVRMDMKSLEGTKERAKEIAAKMRRLQKRPERKNGIKRTVAVES